MKCADQVAEPYSLWARVLVFILVTGLLTWGFGYFFILYRMGMGMSVGSIRWTDRALGLVIILGYLAAVALVGYGAFRKVKTRSGSCVESKGNRPESLGAESRD